MSDLVGYPEDRFSQNEVQLSHNITLIKRHVRPATTQFRLGFRSVGSESSLSMEKERVSSYVLKSHRNCNHASHGL